MKVWFVEDTDGQNHGYGLTEQQAQTFVMNNRGYDTFAECVSDGWAKPAVVIEVLEPVAQTLLNTCKA